jgi:hypothetical protein
VVQIHSPRPLFCNQRFTSYENPRSAWYETMRAFLEFFSIFARNGETSFLSCEDFQTKGLLRPKRWWMGRETIAQKYGIM